MKKKTSLSEEDQALFRQLMTGTRKIAQDTIVHRPLRKNQRSTGQTSAAGAGR
jgi:DNA-nicking Smr family endonuclease